MEEMSAKKRNNQHLLPNEENGNNPPKRKKEKAMLEDMTKKFWQTIISNSIPTTERYIDDLHSTISNSLTHINNEMTESANEQITSPNNHISVHQQAEQIYSNKYFKDPTTFLSSHDFLDFAMPYSNPPNWEKEDGDSSIQWLDKKFSECLLLENSSSIDDLFQKSPPTFEDLFVIDKINKEYDYPDIDFLQVLKDYIYTHTEANEMQETDKIDCTKEKFCLTQLKFVRPNHNCRDSKLYCLQQGTVSTTTLALDVSRNTKSSQSTPPARSFPTTQNYNLGSTSNACQPHNSDIDIPSFTAITDSLNLVPMQEVPNNYQANYSPPGCSSILPKTNYESLVRNSGSNTHFLYSNSPLRAYHNSSEKAANRFSTPIPDPIMYQVLEDYEAECLLRDKAAAEEPPMQNFSSASELHKTTQLNSKQVIFSTAVQADFFKMMSSLLPHIDISQRIFQIDNVWVDQKTLTVSMRPGGWMNPHTLDCYSKMLNTDLLNRGRQGLIPSNEPIVHIVGIENMELLMRPLLNHSDPICADMLSEATVGFSLQNANFVHLPCFNDKQWIVITDNFDSGKFFDIMNPDGSGNNKFTTIISTVTFNFKSLFAKTYPNCIAFNIKEFDYRFVPVPQTHFRYDTGIFLLQILKTYRGMGVPGFTTHDLQAVREIFLYEIATCSNSEVQLPLVKAFQQNHGFRLFR
ncbi:uncharacterized protein LOC119360466 isoform X3 [Triticum dicoccoides]|uniref:uncharacterized protein LOC119360466 isoform X3 n=1 Tax=Triticum dicoccoides TaxID=85692 RepID=UPI00188FA196|nr:uncharacterized protein LOC119360466 isoform X3 [Triticum dicoccoides]